MFQVLKLRELMLVFKVVLLLLNTGLNGCTEDTFQNLLSKCIILNRTCLLFPKYPPPHSNVLINAQFFTLILKLIFFFAKKK